MLAIKKYMIVSNILGVISLLALLLCHLALTDIAHGEPDLTLEWTILRLSALIFILFLGSTFITLRQILKVLPQELIQV